MNTKTIFPKLFKIVSFIVILSMALAACAAPSGDQFAGAGGVNNNKSDKETQQAENTKPANGNENNNNKKITLCHATGSATNPYVEITVDDNATKDGHGDHKDDIIPAPKGGCPSGEKTQVPENTKPANNNQKITLCHATGSATNPYVEITVDDNATKDGHGDHKDDIIPAPKGGCPKGPEKTPESTKPGNQKITLCHATGSATNPYVEITVDDNATKDGHGNHKDDIIPAPSGGCPKGPEKTPEPTKPGKITLCHATGSATNPYVEITVDDNATKDGHGNHKDDIIPAPAGGCPSGSTPTSTPETPVTNTPEVTPTSTPEVTSTNTPSVSETPSGTPKPKETVEPVAAAPLDAPCIQCLIFHTFRDNNLEIYRLDGVEGQANAKLTNLSQSDAVDSRPSRAPNDSRIVFQSNRNGNVELYTTDMLGSAAPVRLTKSQSNNTTPMYGPDARTIVFQSDRNGNIDLFTIDDATGAERQITSSPSDDVNPFYSPDLKWLVFQSNRNNNWDIFILNTETGNEYQLTSSSANETFPAWSPNGAQIAFISDENGGTDLYIIDVSGTNLKRITSDGKTINAVWSPEGNRIAYQSERNGNLDIYSYDLLTGKEYRVTDFDGPDSGPTWDCSGSNLAFTSTRDGDPNIFQAAWQGGGASNMTVDPSTDKWSQWRPSNDVSSTGY
jgi:Tol biopolymer transport system component